MIKKYNLDSSLVNYIDNLGMGVEARGALGGTVYYVENNAGNDKWDGLSIDKPFKTLAKAIAVSNVDMARRGRWAKRNTIYYFADSETASLTEFPQKCDIIGCGSCDAYDKASIKGLHTSSAEHLGCRWFNVRFKPSSAGDLFTLSAYDNGMQFHNCQFVGSESSITASNAIVTAACELLVIENCDFDGAFTNEVVYIGTGNASGLKIVNNIIRGGAGNGIYIKTDATFTNINGKGLIDNNRIYVATVTINDVSGLCLITRNRCISAAASGTGGVGAFVGTAALCCDNQITAAGITFMYPLAFDADGTT
jgi:hypothetical protein